MDLSSALAFLGVMPIILGFSLLCKPDEWSKAVTLITTLPGEKVHIGRFKQFKVVNTIKPFMQAKWMVKIYDPHNYNPR